MFDALSFNKINVKNHVACNNHEGSISRSQELLGKQCSASLPLTATMRVCSENAMLLPCISLIECAAVSQVYAREFIWFASSP